MKLAVLGATGGTGEQVVRQALAAGHQVSALARRREALRAAFPQLHIVQGDIDDRHAVHQAFADTDAVSLSIGQPNDEPGHDNRWRDGNDDDVHEARR